MSAETALRPEATFKKPNINLVGLTGSGKSTIGLLAAESLGMRFVDADRYISEKYGTVDSIINSVKNDDAKKTKGWTLFRGYEKRAVRELCRLEDTVIAWGGGVVEDDEHNTDERNENAIHLATNGVTVWIEISPTESARRADLVNDQNRPVMGETEKVFTTRLSNREASYSNVSDYKVSNEGTDPAIAADAIVCAVQKFGILTDKQVIAL